MDFLDKLVLPQSSHHMVLLKYLLVLTYLIFIPYFSVLIGSNLLSVYFNRKASKRNDHTAYKLSKELIDLVTFNKSIVLGLGIVPILSAMFCYAQLLHMSSVNTSGYMIITIILFFVGIMFLYSYKNSFHMKDILKAASSSSEKDADLEKDIHSLSGKAEIAFQKFGVYSLFSLMAAAYIFIGTVKLASDSSRWESVSSIFGVIFSVSTLSGFMFFVITSLLVTSAVMLFNYFRPNSEVVTVSEDVKYMAKKSALLIGMISTILLPVFLLINTLVIPGVGLDNGIFALLIFIMFIIIITANLFYMMLKNEDTKYSTSLIFLVIVLFVSVTVKDQLAFDTSSQLQFEKLVKNYDEYQVKLKEELGLAAVEVSGESIYNGRCVACHNFDKKIVGPPYLTVLPKYEGNIPGLVKFILNPVKVDPNYTSMPNQGLKPNEAQAVAEYIMSVYQEKYKK